MFKSVEKSKVPQNSINGTASSSYKIQFQSSASIFNFMTGSYGPKSMILPNNSGLTEQSSRAAGRSWQDCKPIMNVFDNFLASGPDSLEPLSRLGA